jgi:hypothetical protein
VKGTQPRQTDFQPAMAIALVARVSQMAYLLRTLHRAGLREHLGSGTSGDLQRSRKRFPDRRYPPSRLRRTAAPSLVSAQGA